MSNLIVEERPQIVMNGDSARARRTDPISSQLAGDLSQLNIRQTKRAVLLIVQQEGEIVGSEINDLYMLRAPRSGWDRVAFDTPRKRAGELAADGFLEVVQYRTAAGNHSPEAEYRITDRGRKAVAL